MEVEVVVRLYWVNGIYRQRHFDSTDKYCNIYPWNPAWKATASWTGRIEKIEMRPLGWLHWMRYNYYSLNNMMWYLVVNHQNRTKNSHSYCEINGTKLKIEQRTSMKSRRYATQEHRQPILTLLRSPKHSQHAQRELQYRLRENQVNVAKWHNLDMSQKVYR
jgi:hypothetical protein